MKHKFLYKVKSDWLKSAKLKDVEGVICEECEAFLLKKKTESLIKWRNKLEDWMKHHGN